MMEHPSIKSNGWLAAPALGWALLAGVAGAQDAGSSVRDYVVSRCGTQLTAFEAVVGVERSVWQSENATTPPAEPVTAEHREIGAWAGSAYPLIDAMVLTQAVSGSQPDREKVSVRLRSALELTNCLKPQADAWSAAEKSEPESFLAEARSVECVAQSAQGISDALASDLEGTALQAEIEKQLQVLKKPCETKER
jgi:hypothetical protein